MLIDEAMLVAARHPNGNWFLPMLKNATVVKIQNVADYIFESPLEKWNIEKDFPNISPPFELIWFEWRQHADWCFDGNRPSWMADRYPMSMFLVSIDTRQHGDDLPDLKEWLTEFSPDSRWVTFGHFYWDAGRAFSSPPAFGWGVSEEGQFRPIGGGFQTRLNPLCPVEANPTEKDFEEASGLQALLPIAFMALSFMHCKNVQVVEGPAWPVQLQKAREKRGKPPEAPTVARSWVPSTDTLRSPTR